MLRIVFVTRTHGSGGTEKHLGDLIQRLQTPPFEVVVLTMALDPYSALFEQMGLRVGIIAGPRTGRFATAWRTFRSLKPNVIVFTAGELGLFHWQMHLAARLSGARRVVAIEHSIADPPPEAGRSARPARGRAALGFWGWLGGLVRRKLTTRLPGLVCDVTICVSDAVRDRLVRGYGYPASKTITRRNGVDVTLFNPDGRIWPTPEILAGRPGGPVAVCVSSLVPSKRIDLLIQAMKSIATQFPDSRCVIVGGGFLEPELRSMAGELKLERHVLFAGQTDEVRPYLAASDIFVLPSEREGLPLSVLEATAFGLPCVVADAGGNREVIRDGVNGFVMPPGSAPALAEAIARLFADPAERARMGRNARKIAEEEFDIEKSMEGVKSTILSAESI